MGVIFRNRIVAIALLAVVALAVAGCGDEEQGPFRIGVMESVTGAGETYGTVAVQSKQLAVDEINAAGGINGRMVELIVEDSKCNAQDAITAYNKLTDVDGVKIILGTSCSGAMLGAAPLAEKEGVVMFSGLGHEPGHCRGRGLHLPNLAERRHGRRGHGQRAMGPTAFADWRLSTNPPITPKGCAERPRRTSRSSAARSWPRRAIQPTRSISGPS